MAQHQGTSMLHRRIFLKILGAMTATLSGVRAEQTFAASAGPVAVDHIDMARSAAVTMGSVQKAYSFFTAPEIRFIEAATALLIPADELGGGAREAEVSIFIDWQLAGSFGANAWTYRQGPWTSETGTVEGAGDRRQRRKAAGCARCRLLQSSSAEYKGRVFRRPGLRR